MPTTAPMRPCGRPQKWAPGLLGATRGGLVWGGGWPPPRPPPPSNTPSPPRGWCNKVDLHHLVTHLNGSVVDTALPMTVP